jgi:two-component system, OmpR family, manganese sensing response regulator
VSASLRGIRGTFLIPDARIGCLARTNGYDLVVLDNVLPKKTGLEVCQEIRAAGKTMPILMLSERQEPATKAKLLDSGADDYLGKPFSVEELL